VARKTNQRLEE